ncbi:DUF3253 domain-containing protein [Streptomyces sp. NPDC056632]|uniref:DUF3253 domain-containing protein n=1 Tax=Streptomyces sp. NPDC056632 TaxID=3345884 RepID=UPI003683509B
MCADRRPCRVRAPASRSTQVRWPCPRAESGRVEVTQGGRKVAPGEARGPIRVGRSRRSAASTGRVDRARGRRPSKRDAGPVSRAGQDGSLRKTPGLLLRLLRREGVVRIPRKGTSRAECG